MKLYIATRFDMWRDAKAAALKLADAGHEITSRWIQTAEDLDGECTAIPVGDDRRLTNALIDVFDIRRADGLVVLVPDESGTGMWWEAGFAYGIGKPVAYVGPGLERTIFAELCATAESIDELLAVEEANPSALWWPRCA